MRNAWLARSVFIAAVLLWQVAIKGWAADGGDSDTWFSFAPPQDKFTTNSPIDLRFLNEIRAGENGFVKVKNGRFQLGESEKPVRFWAVNGPPHNLQGEALKSCARMLAKKGVNMVRIHGGYFDGKGEVDRAKVLHAFEMVEAFKAEGIYTHFSVYFPLWIRPGTNTAWLKGYDGKQHPFAALFFNADFQGQYRKWWDALLNTTNPASGKTMVDEPAVAGLEMQNEDSFFFWTFMEKNLPEPQLALLEKMFGDWAAKKYGSAQAALEAWKGVSVKRDAPASGRLGFRPLYSIFNEKKVRDQDTTKFLYELQTRFYSDTYAYLRKRGFKGVICASNWATASPEVFGPLEKWSYTVGDFVDRHGYFSCNHDGENAAWSIREGHTFAHRSAYRFDAETPGKPKVFLHPLMDVHYDNKPSVISETTWNRPNRYRSEAPLYAAAYGALQHSDAIVHFALDGAEWSVKPQFWMQPWTLISPVMMGQFPAAALMYRAGLVSEGKVMARVRLNTNDLLNLKGTPLPQDAALDELRQKDLPKDVGLQAGQRIDPLIHFVGRTDVTFSGEPSSTQLEPLTPFINHEAKRVRSTTGELDLDYDKGTLRIDAPAVQGVSGHLGATKEVQTRDFAFSSDMELGHIVVVALDSKPLDRSKKMLLQVMSEEEPNGFKTAPATDGKLKITAIGTNPWKVRKLSGVVECKSAANVRVTPLDANGYPAAQPRLDRKIQLEPGVIYYLIER